MNEVKMKEFKGTIDFDRQYIFEENSWGITRKSGVVKMRADIEVFKNLKDQWQGSLEMYVIDPPDGDDWYMECWIGFQGGNAVDYDGTSGYLPDEVLDLIDKNGFNTDDIRREPIIRKTNSDCINLLNE
tara:strand:+ start:3067 stop:3453 length:387 start_codon:yes stop_codon:yes gene_type:complete